MITTIQINDNVKRELNRLKSKKETYEQVILELMRIAQESKRKKEELLIEGCKVMAEDNLRINSVWETIDSDVDWKW